MSSTPALDAFPPPSERRQMKLVIAGCSRSGTYGLYQAMKILGYKPYHMAEASFIGGPSHIKVFDEALTAYNNRFSGLKRYRRAEFDKWLGDYDCFVELSSYLGPDALKAYSDDPDVKFILNERDPDKWVRSWNNTLAWAIEMAHSFPVSFLKYFHETSYLFLNSIERMYWTFSDGTNPGDKGNEEAMRRNYVDYIAMAKRVLPPERTLVIRLEDGLDWDTICPFLEKPVPDEPYPRGNEPATFKILVGDLVSPMYKNAMLRLGALALPTLGIAGWVGLKYGPKFAGVISRK